MLSIAEWQFKFYLSKRFDMAKFTEHLTDEEARQQYSKRVKMFLTQVEKCLPKELEMHQSIPDFTVTDITGTYQIEMATIYKCVPEPDNFVADIFPLGVTTLLGEGLLDISGPFGGERFIYFCRETVSQMQYRAGMIYPVYRDAESEGWYWLKDSMNNQAISITSERLFNLIKKVSTGGQTNLKLTGLSFKYIFK